MNFPISDLCGSIRHCLRMPAILAFALLAPSVSAQVIQHIQTSVELAARYPSGTINSIELADKVLEEIAHARTGIEARFESEGRDCYSKFFATSCLEDAREQRRRALTLLRPLEVEANTFKRKERVVERDRNLEQRRVEDVPRTLLPTLTTEELAPASSDTAHNLISPMEAVTADRKISGSEPTEQGTRRAVQLRRQGAAGSLDEKKRAENTEAYRKKLAESEARQREIAVKRAEKELQRADKDASASKP
jgi:colicin import membrane protein